MECDRIVVEIKIKMLVAKGCLCIEKHYGVFIKDNYQNPGD